ncbi:unnamed protein product [Psylliodes chrysocephalus]|uniref:Uncharacterized protein n=1 Tax=Psylliodes chrysocephalus TaxID=3402493 RepID=A0A9P0GA85_9CUCU|nr:unnamed protein product [Psylliodes chrysocephala]
MIRIIVDNFPSTCSTYTSFRPLKLYSYTYTEVAGKKGADDVASLLWDYIFNYLYFDVKELTIFCDSCCGQNKNFTVFRMLHYIIHFVKRFKKISDFSYPRTFVS